jgi:paired amphipathic helix protein Sin3a
LGKEDQVSDETITSEEKWSLYVDQFVQLSTSETPNVNRRDPFCKRNLPAQVGEEPPLNVETRSGLELKICVNTYKIFFVDNTEDYFRRKPAVTLRTDEQVSQKRTEKFNNWLDSQKGWKSGLTSLEAKELEEHYRDWIAGKGIV